MTALTRLIDLLEKSVTDAGPCQALSAKAPRSDTFPASPGTMDTPRIRCHRQLVCFAELREVWGSGRDRSHVHPCFARALICSALRSSAWRTLDDVFRQVDAPFVPEKMRGISCLWIVLSKSSWLSPGNRVADVRDRGSMWLQRRGLGIQASFRNSERADGSRL